MAIDTEIVEELKTTLLKAKVRLEKDLGVIADKSESGEFSTRFPEDIGSREDENATEVETFTDHLAIEDTLESQIKDIDDALVKMENGTYGVCEKTGKDIPIERLKVYPSARTVVDA